MVLQLSLPHSAAGHRQQKKLYEIHAREPGGPGSGSEEVALLARSRWVSSAVWIGESAEAFILRKLRVKVKKTFDVDMFMKLCLGFDKSSLAVFARRSQMIQTSLEPEKTWKT